MSWMNLTKCELHHFSPPENWSSILGWQIAFASGLWESRRRSRPDGIVSLATLSSWGTGPPSSLGSPQVELENGFFHPEAHVWCWRWCPGQGPDTKHLAISSHFSHQSIGWKLMLALGVSGGSTWGSHIFLESRCWYRCHEYGNLIGSSVLITSIQNGLTPLHLACLHDHEKLATFLLSKGANVDIQTNVRQDISFLHCWTIPFADGSNATPLGDLHHRKKSYCSKSAGRRREYQCWR